MSHSSLLRFLFFFLVSYGKFFIELNLRHFEVAMRRAGKESKMGILSGYHRLNVYLANQL